MNKIYLLKHYDYSDTCDIGAFHNKQKAICMRNYLIELCKNNKIKDIEFCDGSYGVEDVPIIHSESDVQKSLNECNPFGDVFK